MPFRDHTWLSLTPEPERLLPEARAVLRSGQVPPPPALVASERAVAERLVLRARRARWDAWLRESEALAARGDAAARRDPAAESSDASPHDPTANLSDTSPHDPTANLSDTSPRDSTADSSRPPIAATAALVRDVVANHDALALGLPGERSRR